MTWFKVDDNLATHPKVLAAGNTAMGLWVRAGAWSSAQLTDGFVPATMVAALGGKKTDANRLVSAGLWEIAAGGYRFHDWLDRNPKSEDIKQGRQAMSSGSAWGNHRRWHAQRGVIDDDCPHCQRRIANRLPDRVPDDIPDDIPDNDPIDRGIG